MWKKKVLLTELYINNNIINIVVRRIFPIKSTKSKLKCWARAGATHEFRAIELSSAPPRKNQLSLKKKNESSSRIGFSSAWTLPWTRERGCWKAVGLRWMSESASVRVGRSPWTGERTAVYFIDQQQNILISKKKKNLFKSMKWKKKRIRMWRQLMNAWAVSRTSCWCCRARAALGVRSCHFGFLYK